MSRDRPIRPDDREIALCFVAGRLTGMPLPPPTGASARHVLELRLAGLLANHSPCCVAFSGGRDSSAVLAVAAHVARREGLPVPVPVIARYPDAPESDETSWQEAVLEHLRLRERVVVTVHDEERILGEGARRSLLRHGLMWPPALHVQSPVLNPAAGGVLITGEGGDEVIGSRRVTPFALLVRHRRLPSRRLLLHLAEATAPDPVRRRAARTRILRVDPWPWLREEVTVAAARYASDFLSSRFGWAQETWELLDRRGPQVFEHNYRVVAAADGVDLVHPYLEPEFVSALAHEGGFLGFDGRTDLFRSLAADLLPDNVLSRTSKATFNVARFGSDERDFARRWDGTGVPSHLVDGEALRRYWLSSAPSSTSGLLMQAAWLRSQGMDNNANPVPRPIRLAVSSPDSRTP